MGADGTHREQLAAALHAGDVRPLIRLNQELVSTHYGPSDAWLAHPPKGPVPHRPAARQASPCRRSPRAYVLRPLPRLAERSSGSIDPIAPCGLRPMRGDSALAFNLSWPAQASLELRPVRSLTRLSRMTHMSERLQGLP